MRVIFVVLAMIVGTIGVAQQSVNPVIRSTGGIYEVPFAVEKPDPGLSYKIVIDMQTAEGNNSNMAFSVNNLARMINLHAVGGVSDLEVVGVLHGASTKAVMSNEAYKKRYGVDNPNSEVIKELVSKGVKLFVCGQSLIARDVDPDDVMPEIKIATAALTVLTTYQLRGFAALRF